MESRRLIITSVLPTVIALLIVGYVLISTAGLGSVNRNILYITQSVTTFTGTVKEVKGNIVTVEKTVALPTPSAKPSTRVSPTPELRRIIYKVQITGATRLVQAYDPLDYTMKTGLPLPQTAPSVRDIRVNDWLAISTKTDLRTLTGDTFTAESITLPPLVRFISGTLLKKDNQSIVISGSSPFLTIAGETQTTPQQQTNQQQYTFNVKSSAKIIKNVTSADLMRPSVSSPVTLNDVPVGLQVNIYTDKPINDSSTVSVVYMDFMEYTPLTPVTPVNASSSAAAQAAAAPVTPVTVKP